MSPLAYCTVWFVIGVLTYPHIDPFHTAIPFVLFLLIRESRLDFLTLLVFLSFGFHYSVGSSPYQSNELVVFHDYQNTLIGIKEDRNVNYLHDTSQTINQRLVDDYNIDRQITNDNFKNLPLGLQWDGGQLLIVDEHMLYDFPSLAGNLIALRNSPKVHLDHLIQSLRPKGIIADGSNFKSYINRWKKAVSPMVLSFMTPQQKARLYSTLKLCCEVFVIRSKVCLRLQVFVVTRIK